MAIKLVKQSHEVVFFPAQAEQHIERCGRTCYKSEDRITKDSAGPFCNGLVKRGHHAMIEHASATVKFITNRGVTHELVRHRLASFAQESTRYVRYGAEPMEFIIPVWVAWGEGIIDADLLRTDPRDRMTTHERWLLSMVEASEHYEYLLREGWRPEQAREVLPNSLKTEIVVTANLREWGHIFNLRARGTTGKPHPQMQDLMVPVMKEFMALAPSIFGVEA